MVEIAKAGIILFQTAAIEMHLLVMTRQNKLWLKLLKLALSVVLTCFLKRLFCHKQKPSAFGGKTSTMNGFSRAMPY